MASIRIFLLLPFLCLIISAFCNQTAIYRPKRAFRNLAATHHVRVVNRESDLNVNGVLISTKRILTVARVLLDREDRVLRRDEDLLSVCIGDGEMDEDAWCFFPEDFFVHQHFLPHKEPEFDIGLIDLILPAAVDRVVQGVPVGSLEEVQSPLCRLVGYKAGEMRVEEFPRRVLRPCLRGRLAGSDDFLCAGGRFLRGLLLDPDFCAAELGSAVICGNQAIGHVISTCVKSNRIGILHYKNLKRWTHRRRRRPGYTHGNLPSRYFSAIIRRPAEAYFSIVVNKERRENRDGMGIVIARDKILSSADLVCANMQDENTCTPADEAVIAVYVGPGRSKFDQWCMFVHDYVIEPKTKLVLLRLEQFIQAYVGQKKPYLEKWENYASKIGSKKLSSYTWGQTNTQEINFIRYWHDHKCTPYSYFGCAFKAVDREKLCELDPGATVAYSEVDSANRMSVALIGMIISRENCTNNKVLFTHFNQDFFNNLNTMKKYLDSRNFEYDPAGADDFKPMG